MIIYPIVPVPKPRQTQRDKWGKPRPEVRRYREFADEVRIRGVKVEPGNTVLFFLPMAASWPPSKRRKMVQRPHLQRPDLDNLLKALLDAIYDNDSIIWSIGAAKYWSEEGAIAVHKGNVVEALELPEP